MAAQMAALMVDEKVYGLDDGVAEKWVGKSIDWTGA